MRASVIVSTFNQPAWLEKVLWGYAYQSHRDFDVIVADDGSGRETRDVIAWCRRKLGLSIEHVWQPHEGFRKCRILNRAIEESRCDYLIFTDGDCLPRRDFVATHVAQARDGTFLSGGVLRLPRPHSQAVGLDDIASGRAFHWRWLRAGGCNWWRLRAVVTPRWMAHAFDLLTPTRPSFNGHNSSAWKCDVVRVNGFDERMKYGGLDRELGERLVNAGVRPRQVRHRSLCVHLDHPRDYVDPQALAVNRQIRWTTRLRNATWTDFGLLSGRPTKEPVILAFPLVTSSPQPARRAA